MSAEKEIQSPTSGFAARGFSAAYDKVRQAAKRELDETEAGPKTPLPVPADDTAMKNPDGDLQHPSAMPPRRD